MKNEITLKTGVQADKEIIERVFVNLLSNAIKYTPNNGNITLSAIENPKSGSITVSITDTGQGIPQDQLHKVFEKFVQVHEKKSGKVRSTGLGLTFCKMAVEAYGGEIGVKCEEGTGTTFLFTLFAGKKLLQPEVAKTSTKEKAEFELSEFDKNHLKPYIAGLQIFLVYETSEMDGIEFIKQLRKKSCTADVPVIMCTGVMTSSENLDTALQAGAVDYIRKQVDKIELIARTKANLHLADSYKKIKKLNEAKDKIFSIISHDLRSPVGHIKSIVELILAKQSNFDNKQIMDILALIGKQSGSVLNVLENLFAWANNQRNNIEYQPKFQEINLAGETNIDLLAENAKNKNIEVSNEVKNSMLANFDLTLISTVVRNLIANAIKFTHENGKITIEAEEKESHVIVSVTDTGVGINPEQIDRLFDNTSYKTTYGTNSEKGSWLGLKICKDFVEKNKGEIWVKSEIGKGSSFCFSIPME